MAGAKAIRRGIIARLPEDGDGAGVSWGTLAASIEFLIPALGQAISVVAYENEPILPRRHLGAKGGWAVM